MKLKKFLSLSLALVMSLSLAVPAMAAEEEEKTPVTPYTVPADVEGKLVVIHTNDTHGHDVAVEGETVGTAGVVALKKAFEEAGAEVLLVSAGDFSQGTTLVSLDKGASAVEFMNAAGYDVAAPGNHEFDYKMEALKANQKLAQFPILAANIVDAKTGKPLFGDNCTFDTKIGKVGVFGLDTPETMTKAHPDNVAGLTFYQGEELVKCAQEQVKALQKAKCDYIIAVCHLGTDAESEPNRSVDVLAGIKGIDLIVDGHSHTEIPGGEKVGDALMVSTGEYLNNVGVVITDGKKTEAALVSAAEWTAVDEDVAKVVNDRNEEVSAELNKAFATTEVLLNGEKDPGNRTGETNLGDFAADAILWQAKKSLGEDKVDIALTNGGGIRATIQAGDVTMNDMKTVFPFGNEVATIELTGAALLEALEAATCSTPNAIGAFPQVAGINFTIDTTVEYVNGEQYPDSTYYAPANPGARVTITDVAGEPWDAEATYVLATNDFTAAGGDTYYVFKTGTMFKTGVALEDALVNYTREVLDNKITAEKYGEPAGRITIKVAEKDADANLPGNNTKPIDQGNVVAIPTSVEAETYVTEKGWMTGTDKGFEPDGTVTRATVYEMFWKMEGKNVVNYAMDYTDIPENVWYTESARWATSEKLTNGVGDGLYAGDTNMTRQEVFTVLYRYMKERLGKDVSEGAEYSLEVFEDYEDVQAWAVDAAKWAWISGVACQEDTDSTLDPAKPVTRMELAQMLTVMGGLI